MSDDAARRWVSIREDERRRRRIGGRRFGCRTFRTATLGIRIHGSHHDRFQSRNSYCHKKPEKIIIAHQ